MTCSYHFISIVSCWGKKKQMWENDTMLHQLNAPMLVHSLLVGWSWGCQKLWDYNNDSGEFLSIPMSDSHPLLGLPSEIAGSQNAVHKRTRWKRWNRETLCRAFCCFEEKRCKFARTEAFIRVPRRRGQFEVGCVGWWLMLGHAKVQKTKEKPCFWDGVRMHRNLCRMSDFRLKWLTNIHCWFCWPTRLPIVKGILGPSRMCAKYILPSISRHLNLAIWVSPITGYFETFLATLWWTNIAMERSTIFNGKIHYFDWAIFNSFLYVHQRVSQCSLFFSRHVLGVYPWFWVNYNNSLTWIKAIWGWFPLLTMIPVSS